jgi:hypothetical protein
MKSWKRSPISMGLLSLYIREIVHSKDFGKVDHISLDNVEPLVRRGIWTSWREEDLSDNKDGVCSPVFKEVKTFLDFWLKSGSKDC